VIEELKTTHSQVFDAKKRLNIKSIRPNIYKHATPAGTFTFSIIQDSVTLASKSYTATEIETLAGLTPGDYFHGPFNFEFDDSIVVNKGNFTIQLSASGYTFSESAYFGWVKPHEDISVDIDYTITNGRQNPFGVEIWTYQGQGTMTRVLDIDDGYSSATTPTISSADVTVTGSFASPIDITAGTGVQISDVTFEVIHIQGDTVPINITANPQIEAPTTPGTYLLLVGANDSLTVTLQDGDGINLNSNTFTMKAKDTILLNYTDNAWQEVSRGIGS
jgi:hypothetical protein